MKGCLFAAVLLLAAAARTEAAPVSRTRTSFGLWYSAWWTQDDRYQHWSHCHRLPLRGKWVYNGDNHAAMKTRQTWGWGAYEPPPLRECMSIWPGHRYPGYVASLGNDPLEAPREGGQLYVRQWLSVLKVRPQFVTVADWNNFEEETALEDSDSWEDRCGFAVPDLYRRITRAYSRLRDGTLVQGEYYRSESGPEVFFFDGRALIHQAAMPRRAAVVLVPDDTFKDLLHRHAAAERQK